MCHLKKANMKKYCLIILILSISLQSYTQKTKTGELTFKIPVTACVFGDIASQSAGIGFGLEKQYKPQYSFNQDIIYLFHDAKNTSGAISFFQPVNSLTGLKLVSGLRRYFSGGEKPSGFFLELDLMNMYTYSQLSAGQLDYNVHRYRCQVTINPGIMVYNKPDKSGIMTMELLVGAGLGYVYTNSKISTNPQQEKIPDDFYTWKGIYPMLNMDFKIGLLLN